MINYLYDDAFEKFWEIRKSNLNNHQPYIFSEYNMNEKHFWE